MSKPYQQGERWWERPDCWNGHCARGFNFQDMGTVQRGKASQMARAVLPDEAPKQASKKAAVPKSESMF